jgi:uncharacterized protein (DUF779 family)
VIHFLNLVCVCCINLLSPILYNNFSKHVGDIRVKLWKVYASDIAASFRIVKYQEWVSRFSCLLYDLVHGRPIGCLFSSTELKQVTWLWFRRQIYFSTRILTFLNCSRPFLIFDKFDCHLGAHFVCLQKFTPL